MKAFSLLRRSAPRLILGSLLLFPTAIMLHRGYAHFSLPSNISSFLSGLCLGTSSNSINFQEIRETLLNSWKGMLATEIARIRVTSGRHAQNEKVKQILERDKNVVELIKSKTASARIILIPKDFQEEGFVAAFASCETQNTDPKNVIYLHSQNTVMDPEFVPSFLHYLSEQEFPPESYLFIIDAQGLTDSKTTTLNDIATFFKDKPNLKTYIFTSLREEANIPGAAHVNLFAYFREQAEHYARTEIDADTTISQFISKNQLESCNKVFRLTRRQQSPLRIYSSNSIIQELTSCVVDTAKGVWALLKLSFYILFGIFWVLAVVGEKSAKKEQSEDRVDEMLREKNLGYVIRDYRGGEACPICLEQIKLVAFLTACKHLYHLECIREWVKRNNNCPLCRKPVALPQEKRRH